VSEKPLPNNAARLGADFEGFILYWGEGTEDDISIYNEAGDLILRYVNDGFGQPIWIPAGQGPEDLAKAGFAIATWLYAPELRETISR
jgi:hypothetical protein